MSKSNAKIKRTNQMHTLTMMDELFLTDTCEGKLRILYSIRAIDTSTMGRKRESKLVTCNSLSGIHFANLVTL